MSFSCSFVITYIYGYDEKSEKLKISSSLIVFVHKLSFWSEIYPTRAIEWNPKWIGELHWLLLRPRGDHEGCDRRASHCRGGEGGRGCARCNSWLQVGRNYLLTSYHQLCSTGFLLRFWKLKHFCEFIPKITVGCFRRDQLWQKLQQEVAVSLTHHEFLELISLVGNYLIFND